MLFLTLDHGTTGNYEDLFLTLQEQIIIGGMNIASSTMYGMKDSLDFGSLFLHHPVFGLNTKLSQQQIMKKTGCDFCWFGIQFDNHLRFRNYTANRVSVGPEFGKFQWDFSCLFRDSSSPRCPRAVRELKEELSLNPGVEKFSQFQYGNTPSCETIDFAQRYWGAGYPRLLRIKQAWDPDNVFNHCHSVGSTEQNCCPY